MRYISALESRPNDPDTTFKLAQTLDKMKDRDGARTLYQNYLNLQPSGKFAGLARKALQKLPPPTQQQ